MAAHGSCYCGAVQLLLEESARPVLQAFCHCKNCRHWSAAPVTSSMVYVTQPRPEAPFWPLSIVDPTDALRSYRKQHAADAKVLPAARYFCSTCGGHLFNAPEGESVVSLFPHCWEQDSSPASPAVLFTPACHVNAAHTALSINDGKPRYKGFANEAAGSGEEHSGGQQQEETHS